MYCVRITALTVVTLVAPLMSPPAPAARARPEPRPAAASDTRELHRTNFTLDGRALPEHPRYHRQPVAGGRVAPAATPAVGTVREWLGLNEADSLYYRKNYELRAVGRHIEV